MDLKADMIQKGRLILVLNGHVLCHKTFPSSGKVCLAGAFQILKVVPYHHMGQLFFIRI